MSDYLAGATNLYGLPATLPAGLSEQASAIIDSYLKRPEGILYTKDADGFPCHMNGSTPTFTYKLTGGAAPGANVTVAVSPPNAHQDMVGEVLVLDRTSNSLREAVVVSAVPDNAHLTFKVVKYAHAVDATGDLGVVIAEERPVPLKRSIVRYSRFPCVSILSLMGRYGYGRRSDQVGGLYQEMNLLSAVQTFGGPPQWIPIDTAQCSWSDPSGDIWVPAGMLLAYYSDVRMRYVAGYSTVPDEIVRATAAVATSLMSTANLGGNGIKSISAGDTRIQRFGATNLDDDSKKLLAPFLARVVF